jgi:ankyrin repeat protein
MQVSLASTLLMTCWPQTWVQGGAAPTREGLGGKRRAWHASVMSADAVVARFCRALWQGEGATVASLARRVKPNGADRWGHTPLSMAAQYGDLPLVALLVQRGASPDQDRTHLTPISLAARRKADDIVRFLRAHGATESLVTAIYLGDRARVHDALAASPEAARQPDEEGTPLLHHAATALAFDVIQLLLEHGVEINATDKGGETALHRACDVRMADPDPVRKTLNLLLARGADPNARNWDQVTPLHQAVRARNLAAAEVLLAKGADPNARDGIRGSTPLRRAVSPTGASRTAGTAALMVPLTRLLLAHGADPDAKDKRGIRVRDSARDPEVCAVLKEHRRDKREGAASKATVKPRKPASRTRR